MTGLFALMLAQSAMIDFTPVQPSISEPVLQLSAQRDSMPVEQWLTRLDALGEAGDDSAWELLGELYANGIDGLARDPSRACDYFERIGDRRGDALHSLAGCYWGGEGRPQDYVRARQLYRQAIDARFLTSLCGLGTMLVRGQGGPVDAEQGVALCRQAAELGDINAKTDLGTFLLMGTGVERNPVEARIWLEEAGGEGQANAAHLLGQIFTRGDGTAVDHERAAHWFRRAHDAGRPDSAWRLAQSLLRRGYRRDGGETSIIPALMRESQAYALIAAERDPDPAVREEAAAYAEAVRGMLAEASE